jgi:prevent-host-death family protein
MIVATMSSREFNQDSARAKREAKEGPVFITERGEPALVLLSIDEYRRLKSPRKSLLEVLRPAPGLEIDFEPPRIDWEAKPADLT